MNAGEWVLLSGVGEWMDGWDVALMGGWMNRLILGCLRIDGLD